MSSGSIVVSGWSMLKYISMGASTTEPRTLIATGVPFITAARDVRRCCPSRSRWDGAIESSASVAAVRRVALAMSVRHSRIDPEG